MPTAIPAIAAKSPPKLIDKSKAILVANALCSYLFSFHSAQNSRRFEQQDHDQNCKRNRVAQFGTEIADNEGFQHSDDQSADSSARNISNTTENGCYESFDTWEVAHHW